MKKPMSVLRLFLKNHAAPFTYNFAENARDNYGYARLQYDSDMVEIEALEPEKLTVEKLLEITFEFTSLHDVSAGGWEEEPSHDIEIQDVTPTKILFWIDNERFNLTEDRNAIKLIKTFINNE